MCGISGIYGKTTQDIISNMMDSINHRGPDGHGLYKDTENNVALGHCRLAVIDLSKTGKQPMSYANRRYWITYNGEIYNYLEIKKELKNSGYQFMSSSDTEVILALYDKYGEKCLRYLRGMFSFIIWDQQEKKLFVARDRFGIKPLYWTKVTNSFLFSSELEGLLASNIVPRRLDPTALSFYFSTGSIPAPYTILSNVNSLLPGHFMVIQHGKHSITQYWDLPYQSIEHTNSSNLNAVEIELELRKQLEESIKLHMISDVPIGAFLSGGIDSTAIVGMMSKQISKPLKTYSIGFEETYNQHSELQYAKLVAERFETDHHEVIVTGRNVADQFDQFIDAIGQPSTDGINTFLVSSAARKEVVVALSGLGGDEFFAGYPHFRWFKMIQDSKLMGNRFTKIAAKLISQYTNNRWSKLANLIAAKDYQTLYSKSRELYSEIEKLSLLSPELLRLIDHENLSDFLAQYIHNGLDPITQTTFMEAKTYMSNTLLRDTDATSMSHALEVRVPLIDHQLAEFAFKIQPQLKLNGDKTKIILIKALRDILPNEVINRKKMGFELPMKQWLAGPLKNIVIDHLQSNNARELINNASIDKLISSATTGSYSYTKIWGIIVLTAWMDRHKCHL